jgi:hypothetical protein
VREHSPSRSINGEEFAVSFGTDFQSDAGVQKVDCDSAVRPDEL